MQRRILIVDDNPDNRTMMRTMLSAHGFEVEQAGSGREGLERLSTTELPDVVLLDVRMPDMSGMEVLQRLKSDGSTASLPVIMVTAQGSDDDVLNAYQEGADYYITKPCTSRQLLYGILLLLENRSRDSDVGSPRVGPCIDPGAAAQGAVPPNV